MPPVYRIEPWYSINAPIYNLLILTSITSIACFHSRLNTGSQPGQTIVTQISSDIFFLSHAEPADSTPSVEGVEDTVETQPLEQTTPSDHTPTSTGPQETAASDQSQQDGGAPSTIYVEELALSTCNVANAMVWYTIVSILVVILSVYYTTSCYTLSILYH